MKPSSDPKGTALKVVGTRPIRHDGVDKVTGRALYGVDARMPNLLQGKVLRSPHAHARILSIDTSRAEAFPGVRAVITARDLPDPADQLLEGNEQGSAPLRYKVMNLLARDKVLYHGHAIAAVAAVDASIAEQALGLIDVRYEVLPPVLDVRLAMGEDAPILLSDLRTERAGAWADAPSNVSAHVTFEEGDVARGFADADLVVEREFTMATVHQGYLESHAAMAHWLPDGQLILEAATQGHFAIRDELADILQWPASRIRVIPLEIGGGFGAKTTTWLEPLAALLSRKSGRPVKVVMSRAEVFMASGPGAGGWVRAKIGVTKVGRITACEVDIRLEAGAFPTSPYLAAAICSIGCYDLANFRVDAYDVVVNKPKTTAYRAPGSPQAAFAVESVVDEICERLQIDPIAFRLMNASRMGSLRADGTPFLRIGNEECLAAARASDHWRTPLLQVPGVKRGRGIASGYWINVGGSATVVVRLNPDGSVVLQEGAMDIGGTRTAIAMQLAEAIGIPVSEVMPQIPDSDSVAVAGLTGGSKTTFVSGTVAHAAGLELLRVMAAGLAKIWKINAGAITTAEGTFTTVGQRVTFTEAARLLANAQVDCSVVLTRKVGPAGAAFAVHIADVEVDEETGKTRVIRYTSVQDAGKAIYPPYVEGQMQGGAAQGIGWALNEAYWYDDQGHLRNASLLDYRMPTALDLPMIETIIVEVANPSHPYGARGVGEVPIVPPLAAVANALHDAVGVRMRDLPITPARLAAALWERRPA